MCCGLHEQSRSTRRPRDTVAIEYVCGRLLLRFLACTPLGRAAVIFVPQPRSAPGYCTDVRRASVNNCIRREEPIESTSRARAARAGQGRPHFNVRIYETRTAITTPIYYDAPPRSAHRRGYRTEIGVSETESFTSSNRVKPVRQSRTTPTCNLHRARTRATPTQRSTAGHAASTHRMDKRTCRIQLRTPSSITAHSRHDTVV